MVCKALLGLGVHDGLSISALRRGEGGIRATVEGRHWQALGSLHASVGGENAIGWVQGRFARSGSCVVCADEGAHSDMGIARIGDCVDCVVVLSHVVLGFSSSFALQREEELNRRVSARTPRKDTRPDWVTKVTFLILDTSTMS